MAVYIVVIVIHLNQAGICKNIIYHVVLLSIVVNKAVTLNKSTCFFVEEIVIEDV